MSLLAVVLTIAVIGVLVGLLNKYGGDFIDHKFIMIINVVVIIAVILWLMSIFGLMDYASNVKVPRA